MTLQEVKVSKPAGPGNVFQRLPVPFGTLALGVARGLVLVACVVAWAAS